MWFAEVEVYRGCGKWCGVCGVVWCGMIWCDEVWCVLIGVV